MDWIEKEDGFRAEAGGFSLSADPKGLRKGLQVSRGGQDLMEAFRLPENLWKEQAEGSYLRGCDLFAAFQGRQQFAECYWRLWDSHADSLSLEYIVSLRSGLQDGGSLGFSAGIQTGVRFQLDPSASGAYVCQELRLGLALLVHPSDQGEMQVLEKEDGFLIKSSTPDMERGVIRRLRMVLHLCSGIPGEKALAEIRDRFAESEIPLTT